MDQEECLILISRHVCLILTHPLLVSICFHPHCHQIIICASLGGVPCSQEAPLSSTSKRLNIFSTLLVARPLFCPKHLGQNLVLVLISLRKMPLAKLSRTKSKGIINYFRL